MTPHGPLLLGLPPLSKAQRRCLRILSQVDDVAHAARKLHWSQALFKTTLAELQNCVGTQHIALLDERVQLSQSLQDLLRQTPCQPAKSPCRSGHDLPGTEAGRPSS